MTRSRRVLLRTLGVATGGLAGCLRGGDGSGTGTDSDGSAHRTTTTASPAGAELLDHTFETAGGTDPASTEESASVDWGGDSLTVTVTGAISHPSIPADARLADLAYDAGSDALSLRVVAFSPTPTGAGTPTSLPSYTRVEYRFTGEFAERLPARVEVYHGGDAEPVLVDESREAADTSAGSSSPALVARRFPQTTVP